MSQRSFWSNQGLSVRLFQPAIDVDTSTTPYTITYEPQGSAMLPNVNDSLVSLAFKTSAVGGFDTCTIGLMGGPLELESWLSQGIGWHVEVVDQANVIRWEGFVDQVSLTIGGLVWRWGPLTSVGNRVAVLYNVEDTSTIPPTTGERTITSWAEDAASQRIFGVHISILNSSSLTAAEAAAYGQLWLRENRRPVISSDVNLATTGDQFSLQVQCKGYWHLMTYPYNQMVNTGTQDLSDKIEDILALDPNGLVTAGNSDVQANTIQVEEYEGDYRKAQDLIKALVKLGDATYNRYTFTVGPGRFCRYAEIPEEVSYQISLSESSWWQMRDPLGAPVRPWEVEAGKWAVLSDVLAGSAVPEDREEMQDDPRYLFIEDVSFTAPAGLQLKAGRGSSVEAALAQWGLDGA